MDKRILRRSLVVGVLAIAVVAVLSSQGISLQRWITPLLGWCRSTGLVGTLAYSLFVIASTMLLLPASLPFAGAGFLYGFMGGVLLVVPSTIIASTLMFFLGRCIGRERIVRKVSRYQKLLVLDSAVGNNGFKIVLMLRLSPVFPYGLFNYAASLSRVTYRDFISGSSIACLPGIFLYVYLGSLVSTASGLAGGNAAIAGKWRNAIFWTGAAITVCVFLFLARALRKLLEKDLTGKINLADAEPLQEELTPEADVAITAPETASHF